MGSVVLIAQLGCGGAVWAPVVKLLDGVDVITYDRPGTGAEPPRPEPNPALPYSAFAAELAAVLDARGVREPVVLAAHSIGGSIMRMFADRYPERVAGLVQIDGSLAQFYLDYESDGNDAPIDGDLPGATAFDVARGQVELMEASAPDVPAVVVTRRHGWWPAERTVPHPSVHDLWYVSQRQLAEEWGAPLIEAVEAGHQVPAEAPALCAYLIGAVVRAARTGSGVELDDAELGRRGGVRRAVGSHRAA
ncbi:alpha/beta hydrolase [Actinoplanes sp. NPDC051851]|uniref:alpha/beta fold hydrolase n=1 Tax=Actinoplanes sp. NPDC051851 TaxID=3154753 RepID=UPI0034350943